MCMVIFLHLSDRYSMYFTFHVQILEGGNLPNLPQAGQYRHSGHEIDLGLFSPLALLRDI